MKITFIKDHLDHKKSDSVEVTNERARYLINVGVAKKTEFKTKKQ